MTDSPSQPATAGRLNAAFVIEQCAVEAAIAEKGNLHYECKAATAIRKLKGTFNLRGMEPEEKKS